MIDRLFPSRRTLKASRLRRLARTGRMRPLELEVMEERRLLAIAAFQYPMNDVDTASNNYAVLVLDQGDAGFLKKNATPSPSFTFANNAQFLNGAGQTALSVGALLTDWGALTTFYVTSGKEVLYAGEPLVDDAPGTTVAFPNDGAIDLGTNDGIVPGTFSAFLSVTDDDGNTESGLVFASSPGAQWNLNFSDDLGSLKPSRGNISERSGNITLQWGTAPAAVTLVPITWAVFTGPDDDIAPLSFTVSPGQDVTQSMIFDLSRVPSAVTINSPVLAVTGPGSTAPFFRPAGSISIDAGTVMINANTSSSSIFRVAAEEVTVNRPVAAPLHALDIVGTPADPGRLLVSEQGALAGSITTPSTTSAGSLNIDASHADLILAGVINAAEQTYLLQSPLDPRAYTLTTVSPTAGVQTGRIIGDTVGITLANDAGGEVSIRTTVDRLRMTASSTPSSPALPYAITVSEADDLTVDAVPASQRPIAIEAAGTLTLTSSVQTTGDLALSARSQLSLTGAISSAAGGVTLASDSIVTTGAITAGGTRDVLLQSRAAAGDVTINGLVRAGGAVKAPVRATTTANVDLAAGGLTTVDGVALAAGDRVLVKNQTKPSENGIYVAVTGSWSRATDASSAQLLVPGFMVAVREGSQRGGWTFANASVPTLEQTGLAFVPASATQTYVPARAATTANVNLAVGGLLTVDGVNLVADDRVLVMNQTNPRQNGLYIAGTGAWVRAADADSVPELVAGSYVFVTEGTANGGKGFVLADDAVQVGITPLAFRAFTVEATRTTAYSPANVLASVVAATTVNIDLAVPPAEIDGVDLVAGDLVLVKNQFDAATNGVYVYDIGGLQRWSGADNASELARGTLVFVEQGATNAGSSWTFNDTVNLLGQTTAGSLQVTGLSSTQYLAAGMLVSGPGIPSDAKIDIVIDGTSVRLTKPASVTSTTAALGFMQTSTVVVGSTPILFVPSGGTVAITAGRSISSNSASPTSRITASAALLTAGRPETGTPDTTSLIDVNSAVGRLTAVAPATVTVSDSGAIDLFDVRSLGGRVAVSARDTVTARFVSAVGTATSPADVTLASLYGDVVTASVTSSVGTIRFDSTNGQVVVRRVGLTAATVRAQDGDVIAMADVGGILIEGPVQAEGTDGDITLQSVQGQLVLLAPGAVQASDRLTVVTPGVIPSLGAGTTVTAAALSITSPFGAAKAPPAGFGTFSTLNVNRTDAGDIDMSSPSALTIEGASTVNGSILFTAPSVSVVGPVTAGTEAVGDGDVVLTATTGSITLAADVTARGDTVRLVAAQGGITQSAGRIDCTTFVWTAPSAPILLPGNTFTAVGVNLTAPGDIRIPSAGTQSGTLTLGRVTTVDGNVVVDADSVVIADLVQAGGTGKTVSVTARGGNIAFVNSGRIDQSAASAGPVTLSAAGAITSATVGANVLAGSLSLTANSGATLRTAVDSLSATVTAGNLAITESDALVLAGLTVPAGTIAITVGNALTQSAPIVGQTLTVVGAGTAGNVVLTDALNDVVTLAVANSGGAVSFTDANGLTVGGTGISASNVTLKAQAGSIAVNAGISAPGGEVRLDASQGLITQAAGTTIDSRAFVWYATAQPTLAGMQTYTAIGINLTAAGNVRIPSAGSQAGTLEVVGASTVDGNVEIDAGAVVISDLVRAGGAGKTATVTARTGNLSFTGPGRVETQSGPITLSAPLGTVSLVNGGAVQVVTSAAGLTVTSGGSVPVGRVTAAGPIVINSSGDVTVGPQSFGLLQSTTSIDLRNVAGTVAVANGGQIIAPTVLLAPGKTIQVGDALNITTAAGLVAVIDSINALPATPGARYEVRVTASFPLTQTITVNRPILFSGTSQTIVLSGSSAVRTGLVLNATASGSIVRNIAFANFGDTAIRLASNTSTSITSVTMRDCGTGLTLNGTSTGTVVRTNVFNRCATGIRLNSATGVTIGGSAAGQGNTIANARQQGIFAQGFCTNSRLVKNSFPGTRTPYNVRLSRNLRIVR